MLLDGSLDWYIRFKQKKISLEAINLLKMLKT